MAELKPVSFKLFPNESEGLKVLAAITGETQSEIVRRLIGDELKRQKEAVDAYKKTLTEVKKKVKR